MAHAQLGFARTITVEVATDGYDGHGYWIGTFNHPLTAESKPKNWQLNEDTLTTLQVGDQANLVLVAVQKSSLPIFKRIRPSSKGLSVEFQFQKGKSLQGEVLSADGFPIKDAVIFVNNKEGLQPHQYPDESIAIWRSDHSGKYLISGLQTGTYELQITPRIGLPKESQQLSIDEEEPEVTEKKLLLQRYYFISGEVVDEEENLVVDGEVIATEWVEGLTSIQTSTDEKGLFRIGPFLKDKSIWVEAQVPDHSFSEVQKVLAGQANLRLTLRKLHVLTGRVIERETGHLVKEFTVSALSDLDSTSSARWEYEYIFDGSMGKFSVEVDWRITRVIVEAPGFDFRFIPISLTNGIVHDLGTIELDRGREVTGTVVDATTGNPIAGAEVRYTQWDDPDELRAFYTYQHSEPTTSNASGEFTLSQLPKEEVTIEVWAKGYFRSETLLSEGQESFRVELWEISHPTILGKVMSNEGIPLKAGLWLYDVDSKRTNALSTNSDGTFEIFTNDGKYELRAGISKHGDSNTETIVVDNQIPVVDVLLTIYTSGSSISGTVSGLAETESVFLRVYDTHGESVRRTYLHGNKSYSFEGIIAGEYRVEGKTSMNRKISKEVSIKGNNSSVIVDLAFDGTSNLSGVVTVGGKPVGNVRVWAHPKTEGLIGGEAKSEEDGSYLIENLEDGEYDIQTNRGLSFTVEITSDTFFDIEVGDLSFAGTVVTELATQDMIVVLKSDSDESIYVTSRVDSEGAFQFDGLTTGSYLVRVTKSGRVTPAYAKSTFSLNLDHSIEGYQIELQSD